MSWVWLWCVVAAGLWFVMFYPGLPWRPNFWLGMSVAAGGLGLAGTVQALKRYREVFRFEWVHLPAGVFSAVVLYGVFWVGHDIARRILHFEPAQVADIYSTRAEAQPWLIGVLLLLLIGPGEELFWRGYVQQTMMQRWKPWAAWLIAAAVYAAVHVWAFNFMLFMAALICGLFWGSMYLKYRSVWPGIISHALWDVAIFVVWPIR